MTLDDEVADAIRRRALLAECQPRPFDAAIATAVQHRVRRAPNSGAHGAALAGGFDIGNEISRAVQQRADLARPVPRPFDQVVPRASTTSPPSTTASAPGVTASTLAPPPPTSAPASSPPPSPASSSPATTPTDPTIPSDHPPEDPAPDSHEQRARQPGRQAGRRVGRLAKVVRVVAVGSLVTVASLAGWFFWADIKCAVAAAPNAAVDACAPRSDTLRAAANDLLDAVQTGDVARIRSHLSSRCSPTDEELRTSAAEAAARSPKITTVSTLGRGGTVNVRADGDEYSTAWLLSSGRWQLQICDALERLAG